MAKLIVNICSPKMNNDNNNTNNNNNNSSADWRLHLTSHFLFLFYLVSIIAKLCHMFDWDFKTYKVRSEIWVPPPNFGGPKT